MTRSAFIAALAAALALPRVASAQGYDIGEYEPGEGEYQEAPPQVDVSGDLGDPGAAASFDSFQAGLAPYGDWVGMPAYGQVWRPRVAAGWRPYYYGQWDWTDEGWFWNSREPWGWATYHYGRWSQDPGYGWFWVPGYQWAPAWVTWRFGTDAIGWAPLWPGWSVYTTNYPAYLGAWTFMPSASFAGYPVYSMAYGPSYNSMYFYGTRPAPPRFSWQGMTTPAWGGPPHGFVERRMGRPVAPSRIVPVSSPGQVVSRPGAVGVYRPEMRPGAAGSARPGAAGPARPGVAGSARPGWGSPQRPGWGPPGRVPAPGAAPASTPGQNRPGWSSPPSRGPAATPPGPRGFTPAPAREAPEGRPRSGFTAPGGAGWARGGVAYAGSYRSFAAPRGSAGRGGGLSRGFAPASRGAAGSRAPAPGSHR